MSLTRLLLVLGLLAACQESGRPADAASATSDPATQNANGLASAATESALTIVARDFAFDAPESMPAGLITLLLDNRGREPHLAWLVRLDEDTAIEDFFHALRAEGPLPPATRSAGGPGRAEPGFTSRATVRLEPGDYLLVCLMTSDDGTSHVRKGMVRHIEVVAR